MVGSWQQQIRVFADLKIHQNRNRTTESQSAFFIAFDSEAVIVKNTIWPQRPFFSIWTSFNYFEIIFVRMRCNVKTSVFARCFFCFQAYVNYTPVEIHRLRC